jgi:hypothetical protein
VYFTCSQVFALSLHWTFVAVLLATKPAGFNNRHFGD